MRKNLSSKIAVVFFIPVVLVASSVALYGFADVEKGVNEEGGLSVSDNRDVIKLLPPPLIGVAGAAEE